MREPSAWWIKCTAKHLRARARKLVGGASVSQKETAKILCDAAQLLESIAARWDNMERRAEVAEAWRAGFEAKEPRP